MLWVITVTHRWYVPDDIAKLSRLPNLSRMLLADEGAEAYVALLADYAEDLRPVGALERRQLELVSTSTGSSA